MDIERPMYIQRPMYIHMYDTYIRVIYIMQHILVVHMWPDSGGKKYIYIYILYNIYYVMTHIGRSYVTWLRGKKIHIYIYYIIYIILYYTYWSFICDMTQGEKNTYIYIYII